MQTMEQEGEIVMTERDFVYWLNGFIELCDTVPNVGQWECIKTHMALVMGKKTPQTFKDYLPELQKPLVNKNPPDSIPPIAIGAFC